MRRFLHGKQYYKSKEAPPLQEKAFHPRPTDIDGLSSSRQKSELRPHFLTEHELRAVVEDEKISKTCGVCAFDVDFTNRIGLLIQTRPEEKDLGHIVFPQILYSDLFNPDTSPEAQEKALKVQMFVYSLRMEAAKRILILPG